MKTGNIYVITHKPLEFSLPEHYQKLYVGAKKLSQEEKQKLKGYSFDDEGDSISGKNASYCELTGLYWIWKNQQADIVGISHYRRFFVEGEETLSWEQAERMLEESDVGVAQRWWVPGTVQKHFARCHNKEDLAVVRQVIAERHPQYVESFDKAMDKGFLFPFNMMICPKTIFDDYCAWLFDILGECEKRVNLGSYDSYQGRIYGFLSERLWLVYLIYHRYDVKETKVREVGMGLRMRAERVIYKCMFILRRLKHKCLFGKGAPYWE